eukprot:scaffold1071_cov166-Amphora_coffeaeformis.AAC.11
MDDKDDPRIFIYGLFTSIYFGWEIFANFTPETMSYASRSQTATDVSILLSWWGMLWLCYRKYIGTVYALGPFLLYNALSIAFRVPHTFEVMIWAMQTDATMLFWLVYFSKTGTSVDALCRTIQEMFSWYYLASGVWKLNSHFWDPDASCGTMFFIQLVAHYGPCIISNPSTLIQVAHWAKLIAPAASLMVEVSMGGAKIVGSLLGIRTLEKTGLVLALLFHLMVCILPFPNDISNFALQCGARLIVVASADGCQRTIEYAKRYGSIWAGLGVCVTALAYNETWSPNTWAFILYVPICTFVIYAVIISKDTGDTVSRSTNGGATNGHSSKPIKPRSWRNRFTNMASTVAFCYSFVGIMLGVTEESTPNMFANLKTHGGSNHWFLPTGLLLHVFGEYPDSHPLGGGEIRIESTTSNWIKSVYPNDLSMVFAENQRAMLEEVGNPAPFYFNGGLARVLGIMPPQTQFYQYTVPALELKRLFREAKEKDGTFELTYAQLPGTKGDEVWRTTATKRRFVVQVKDGIVYQCQVTMISTGVTETCSSDDLPMLPHDNAWYLRRLSMYNAYPIVPRQDNTIPKSITCFGP